MKFITKKNAQKLRSGNTVWRCQIMSQGQVGIEETLLSGVKSESIMFKGYFGYKVGRRHLSDLVTVPCFARRKDAIKFQATVNEPQYAALRQHAIEHWIQCAEWDASYSY